VFPQESAQGWQSDLLEPGDESTAGVLAEQPRPAGHSSRSRATLVDLQAHPFWSYVVLEREVRANLAYRDFTRVGGAKMPDAKTMGRWGVALGPEVVCKWANPQWQNLVSTRRSCLAALEAQ
jgi:hypothetical protein